MYLTKEQLEDAGFDSEKIQKFATLFPNGTEVTRELCTKHPDVFSFGLPGARLMPHVPWKPYWDRVRKAKWYYKWMIARADSRLRLCSIDLENEKGGFERMVQNLADSFSKVPNFNREKFIKDAPRLFIWGPPMPLPPPPIPIQQVRDEYKIEKERLTRERDLKLALIFYETSLI